MGAGPSAPSPEQAELLLDTLDAACAEAAQLILKADVFLLCTGAGFSADSGLAVYADVAKVKAYSDRGLTYQDICEPRWLLSDPELFWGFWGQCFNDYRSTAPHAGYEIIERWVEERFRHSATADAIRLGLEKLEIARASEVQTADEGLGTVNGTALGPYETTGRAGAFFAFTSNVDAHHFDWFRACEIRECHGNTELYQCTGPQEHCQPVWRAPMSFRFRVDPETMLAPDEPAMALSDSTLEDGTLAPDEPEAASGVPAAETAAEVTTAASGTGTAPRELVQPVDPAAASDAGEEPPCACGALLRVAIASGKSAMKCAARVAQAGEPAAACDVAEGSQRLEVTGPSDAEAPPRVGRVQGAKRTTTLRHMPPAPPETSFKGFESNHPKCPFCNEAARPAILMFGDMDWRDVTAQRRHWNEWRRAVEAHAASVHGQGVLRFVILEIGAGDNVTTVRNTSEMLLRTMLGKGADARLVRVNPQFPLGDEDDFTPQGDSADRVISVMARGLDSLKRIDRAMAAIR